MIPLYLSNGQAFVWNADDWQTIREKHRIMGELIGTIAIHPRQDSYLGLPMSLMSEEAILLVEEGFCKLVKCNNLTEIPDTNLCSLVDKTNERLLIEQTNCMKEKRIEQISLRIDMIVSGKQKKSAADGKTIECNREALLQEEIKKLPVLTMENSLIQIPTEHPWPLNAIEVDIDELIPSSKTDIGRVRYAVFRDLWKRNYYITAGTKFGGDFLAYLGDPVKFHAICIVKCLKNYSSDVSLPDIVAFGRLGVSVNKLAVYAYLDEENRVTYQTLQWHDTLC